MFLQGYPKLIERYFQINFKCSTTCLGNPINDNEEKLRWVWNFGVKAASKDYLHEMLANL